jgi:hypothetical protein
LYRFANDGRRFDNITDWALERFREHYEKDRKLKRPITKDAIFSCKIQSIAKNMR